MGAVADSRRVEFLDFRARGVDDPSMAAATK
jgi:hypothetical protein